MRVDERRRDECIARNVQPWRVPRASWRLALPSTPRATHLMRTRIRTTHMPFEPSPRAMCGNSPAVETVFSARRFFGIDRFPIPIPLSAPRSHSSLSCSGYATSQNIPTVLLVRVLCNQCLSSSLLWGKKLLYCTVIVQNYSYNCLSLMSTVL